MPSGIREVTAAAATSVGTVAPQGIPGTGPRSRWSYVQAWSKPYSSTACHIARWRGHRSMGSTTIPTRTPPTVVAAAGSTRRTDRRERSVGERHGGADDGVWVTVTHSGLPGRTGVAWPDADAPRHRHALGPAAQPGRRAARLGRGRIGETAARSQRPRRPVAARPDRSRRSRRLAGQHATRRRRLGHPDAAGPGDPGGACGTDHHRGGLGSARHTGHRRAGPGARPCPGLGGRGRNYGWSAPSGTCSGRTRPGWVPPRRLPGPALGGPSRRAGRGARSAGRVGRVGRHCRTADRRRTSRTRRLSTPC